MRVEFCFGYFQIVPGEMKRVVGKDMSHIERSLRGGGGGNFFFFFFFLGNLESWKVGKKQGQLHNLPRVLPSQRLFAHKQQVPCDIDLLLSFVPPTKGKNLKPTHDKPRYCICVFFFVGRVFLIEPWLGYISVHVPPPREKRKKLKLPTSGTNGGEPWLANPKTTPEK